jgi:DNA repair protein RecN (Recombination protein N)
MIQRILIRNYAIIENLEIDFSEKLTIITGETGAGKSILLGALGMILGNRADTKVLYNDKEKCIIEAFFDISHYNLSAFFETHEIDFETISVVRRELTPQGKTRTFINDTPVNLTVLRQFTSQLVDLHQQFDTLEIHSGSFQTEMVDALADNRPLLEAYRLAFKIYKATKKQLTDCIEKNSRAEREIGFLKFQLEEFNKAELVEGEQVRLEAELQRLSNAETIKKTLNQAFRALSDAENSVVGQLQSVGQAVSMVKKFTPDVQALHERFEGLVYELQDIADEFEAIADKTEYDGARILEFQNRLDVIYKLLKKHNLVSVEDLIALQEDLQKQLDAFGDLTAEIERLTAETAAQSAELHKKAADISTRRRAVAPRFEAEVHALLAQLSMETARLSIQIADTPELTDMGTSFVEFLFAANKGARLQAIRDVASGGELSRLTLCTKSLVAASIPLPTLIFDEIDSGVSGDVALKMGNILQKLAAHHQVVVITHSPQVAAKADKHYFVYKTERDDRTLTNVRPLNTEERIRSIAIMLSQNPPSNSALENAKELLTL